MQTSDILPLVTLAVSAVGAIVAIKQWRESVRVRRAEFVKSLYDEFNQNNRVRQGIYLLDYVQRWYDASFHSEKGKDSRQVAMDVTLAYLSYICYLRKTHILTKAEFKLFRYEIDRAILNISLQDYLYNLYHFSVVQGTEFPFANLLDYAKRRNLFPREFYDKTICDQAHGQFHHVLNF